VKLVVQELTIHAVAHVVFEFLTDPELFVQWMADTATLDPVEGGPGRWTHPNGDTVSGHDVEIVPNRRVVFTYGWERAEVVIAPGSMTVEIDLHAQEADTTILKLVDRGLGDLAAGAHNGGWTHYLDRLRRASEGGRPGEDPWADQCVPTRAELRRP
jgi:uncharacterized protein YndB with AHSA1/START domain